MKILACTILCFISGCLYGQNTCRLYGVIRDAQSGENLSGCSISIPGTPRGTTSNHYGYYTISLPQGTHRVSWSYMGYSSQEHLLTLTSDSLLDIRLHTDRKQISEVEITAGKKTLSVPGSDVIRLDMKEIRSMPAFLGEPDVLRGLQSLPGVLVSHHGHINMSVRGGSYSQNLILLDEAPVFNPSHILGFMSSFNPDIVSTAELYKGVPARYGSKLSSVMDIRMKDGNREKTVMTGGVGLLSSRLTIEGPAWKNKGSVVIAGRFCYAGMTAVLVDEAWTLLKASGYPPVSKSDVIWFYDFNAKTNYTINSQNRIYLSVYNGFDKFFVPDFSGEYLLQWGNLNGTLRWNHIMNPSLFVNTSLIISRFNYTHFLQNDGADYQWDAALSQIEMKSDADHSLTENMKLRYGVSFTFYGFRPGDITPRRNDSPSVSFSLDKARSLETGIYAENCWEIASGLSINTGLRLSTFSNIGPGSEYTFHPYTREPLDSVRYGRSRFMRHFVNLTPRLSLVYNLGKTSIKASYTNMVQYLHKVSNSTLGMPTDIWFAADNNVLPQLAHQFSLGYQVSWNKGYTFSIEPYYKRMFRQVDFRDNADLFINPYLGAEVCSGEGQSKGIEMMLKKTEGKITGHISYTLSETTLDIDGVNNNKPYAAPYDCRHNLKAYLAVDANDKWMLSASFNYSSGRPVTILSDSYVYHGVVFATYTNRNGYRVEDFHELNLSARWTPKPYKKRYKGSWIFSIMNVYNRKNVFSISMEKRTDIYNDRLMATKMYLYGVLPMMSYEFKF